MMKPRRLAIVSTHPIQYHGAWFRRLASEPRLCVEVFYCHQATAKEQGAAGFGVEFDWDVSLLDGYPHRFLRNVARQPSVAGFAGLDTPEIKEIIGRERFDAVMINGWHYKSAWQAMRACWRTRTPVMVRSDSHLKTYRSLTKQAAKWPFYRWFIPKIDACLPVGKWSRDYFVYYGAHPNRIAVVPHIVDTDFFGEQCQKLRPQRAALRAEWGINPEAVVFLFAGKLIEKKRPLDFLRAIREAAKPDLPIAGLMVGDGPLRQECEEFARSNQIPVSFAGFLNQSEISRGYVAADVLVVPSDGGETWGLVVNEAMACGRPCFVSDRVGCGPDLIIPGQTGHVFPKGNVNEIAALMKATVVNVDQLDAMGKQALRNAAKYSLSAGTQSVLNAIELARAGGVN